MALLRRLYWIGLELGAAEKLPTEIYSTISKAVKQVAFFEPKTL